VTFTALCHSFILHQNIHVAFSRATKSDFLSFTHGSHHIHLVDGIAKLFNHLRLEEKTIVTVKHVLGLYSPFPMFVLIKTVLNGWSRGAWLQLVRCALYLSTCP
jgi:hypothetical protein